jgi:thioredoxin reductase (NADPH)
MPSPENFDLIIVGAGPSGLACAIEAQKAGLSYCVLDKGSVANAIQHFQREMYFFSTPELLTLGDVPFIIDAVRPTSRDCVNYYRAVVRQYNLRCKFYEKVTDVCRESGAFQVTTARGARFNCKHLVIATGYYDTPTRLNVPGEDHPQVSHYYRDPLPYYDQDVLIVGGKNSAVEAALDLWRHGARVTVVHRGSALSSGIKYWILPDFENRVKNASITLLLQTTVNEFRPSATLLTGSDGTVTERKSDFVFVLTGYRTDVAFLRSLGIQVEADSLAPVYNPGTMETNVPGLFVAGGLVGGRFNNKVFIENGREHGKLIIPEILRRRTVI